MERDNGRAEQDAAPARSTRRARCCGSVVTVDGARGLVAIDLLFGLLLTGERGDADAACVGGVEAFHEGARLRSRFLRLAGAPRGSRRSSYRPDAARSQPARRAERRLCSLDMRESLPSRKHASVPSISWSARMASSKQAEQFGRAAVDKLRAEFYGAIDFLGMQGEDAAADAVAGFEYGDIAGRTMQVSLAAARPATPAPRMRTSVKVSNSRFLSSRISQNLDAGIGWHTLGSSTREPRSG